MRHRVQFLPCLALSAMTACSFTSEEAIDSSEGPLATYRVEMTTPGPVSPGSTAQLAIRVLGADGVPLTQFDDLHTQPMHVVAVSSDLTDFIHVHPTVGEDGTLSTTAPIALAQPYRFFFEYDPAGPAGEQTSRGVLEPVGGTASVAPGLASSPSVFDGSTALVVTTDTTRLELQPVAHGMIMPGMASTLRIAVKTATGAPASDLVDWLGMPGHAIVLSEDTSTFIHAHAMRVGAGGGGGHGGHGGHGSHGAPSGDDASASSNLLDIDVTLPRAGFYKMFVQVKRSETIVTTPFVLEATSM